MAGLPGFASHGSSLHLGAGCPWSKLLDASGTQPPLCEAVVNICKYKGYKAWLWIAVLSMLMAQNLPMLDSKMVKRILR